MDTRVDAEKASIKVQLHQTGKKTKIKNVPQHNTSHICQTYSKCFIKWETQLRTVFQNQMKAHNFASFIQLCSCLNESKTVVGKVLKRDDSKGKDR